MLVSSFTQPRRGLWLVVAFICSALAACGGGGGNPIGVTVTGTGGSTGPTSVSISGTVSGAVSAGVTVTLDEGGNTAATTVTNASGAYRFDGLPRKNTSYYIDPTLTGYTFSPGTILVTQADLALGSSLTGTTTETSSYELTSQNFVASVDSGGGSSSSSSSSVSSGSSSSSSSVSSSSSSSVSSSSSSSSSSSASASNLAAFVGYPYGNENSAYQDGTGIAAVFRNPVGITIDSAGYVYVTDTIDETIRKITPDGVVTTLAGIVSTGSVDGTGTAARFRYPMGIAIDSASNLYVVDNNNHTIRKITPAGVVSTFAGTAGVIGSADGTGAVASFKYPRGIAIDNADNLFVADTGNGTIRKITPSGVVTTLAGTAGVYNYTDGTGAAAHFWTPIGIAADSAGNLYVTDLNIIRKVTSAGVVTTLAGNAALGTGVGSTDGTGAAATFALPSGVAADGAGNIYVNDAGNNTIRKITPAGVVSTIVGIAGVAGFTPGPLPGLITGVGETFGGSVAIHGSSLFITTNDGVAVVTNVP